MRDTEISVNTKNVPLRVALFVIALAVAVGAFTFGAVKLGHKDEGYQTITAETDDEAVNYANGVELKYFMTGNSNEIKQKIKELTVVYSGAMKRAYKFLDSTKEYAGYGNLATLNMKVAQQQASEFRTSGNITVSSELYNVLKRAYEYTLENRGYNMFAGALYAYWNSILSLDEPLQFDPVADSETQSRLDKLTEATCDLSNFTLEFVSGAANTVCFGVSEKYVALLDELEIPATVEETAYSIIDLNLLHDAFMIEWIAAELENGQYNDGYLETSSGLMLSLPGHNRGEYCIYDFSVNTPLTADTKAVSAGMAVSHFRNVPAGEKEFAHYYVNENGRRVGRSEYVNAITGKSSTVLANSYAICKKAGPVEACYGNIIVSGAGSATEAESIAEKLKNDDESTDFILYYLNN